MDEATRASIQSRIEADRPEEAFVLFLQWVHQHDGDALHRRIMELKTAFQEQCHLEDLYQVRWKESLHEQSRLTRQLLDLLEEVNGDIPEHEPLAAPAGDTLRNILFLASNPSETAKLQLDKEFVQISLSLQDAHGDFALKAEWAVQPDKLQEFMLKHKPHIVHFSGHGIGAGGAAGAEDARGIAICRLIEEAGGIILQDEQGNPMLVNGANLGFMFQNLVRRIPIKLVLLNACYSDDQAEKIAEYVPFVIGISHAIQDATAISFAKGFYLGLGSDPDQTYAQQDIDFAFQMGVTQIRLLGQEGIELPKLWVNGDRMEA